MLLRSLRSAHAAFVFTLRRFRSLFPAHCRHAALIEAMKARRPESHKLVELHRGLNTLPFLLPRPWFHDSTTINKFAGSQLHKSCWRTTPVRTVPPAVRRSHGVTQESEDWALRSEKRNVCCLLAPRQMLRGNPEYAKAVSGIGFGLSVLSGTIWQFCLQTTLRGFVCRRPNVSIL